VGVVDDGVVWMGADSCASNSSHKYPVKEPKLFYCKGTPLADSVLGGYTGSFRFGQLLAHDLDMPALVDPQNKDPLEFVTGLFLESVHAMLKENHYLRTKEGVDQVPDGSEFLFACHGRLWVMQSDFSVIESLYGEDAVGCGADVALGSMYGTRALDLEPFYRIRLALQAAAERSPYVQPPFMIWRLDRDGGVEKRKARAR
jgi:hypothetical protein